MNTPVIAMTRTGTVGCELMVTAETTDPLGHLGGERRGPGVRVAVAVMTALLSAGAVALTLTGAPDERAAAAVFGLLVAAPMIVGLVAWDVHPDDRFARLLCAAGAMFSLTALSQSDVGVLYSVGRVAVWLVVPMLLYLMLAFPSGRLAGGWDRRVMIAVAALVATLYLPTALISHDFPEPSPWALCGGDCPANAFALVDVAFVEDVIQPVREVLTALAVLAVAVLLAGRTRRSGPMLRRATSPVLAVAVLQVVAFAAYLWSRRSGSVPDTVDLLGWLWLLSLPAIALSFAAGLVNRRLHVAAALQRLTVRLRAPATASELRGSLADALEDPSVRVVYWLAGDPGRWVDESGWPAAVPGDEPGAAVTEVHVNGRRLAAVVHDARLATDTAFIRAAAAYGFVVLENTRLIAELQTSLERLSESESRGATAAQDERERIERNLHDGAQQGLVALQINLAQLAERMNGDSPARAEEIVRLVGQVDRTIDEMRSLAHQHHPEVLARHGLAEALRSAAARAPLRTSLVTRGARRFEPDVETTVYFSCLEAVQNAVKHARGASHVTILLDARADDGLRFEVRDDGAGFPVELQAPGAGLTNIKERLASVGGRMTIVSEPGRGTTVAGLIPVREISRTGGR